MNARIYKFPKGRLITSRAGCRVILDCMPCVSTQYTRAWAARALLDLRAHRKGRVAP